MHAHMSVTPSKLAQHENSQSSYDHLPPSTAPGTAAESTLPVTLPTFSTNAATTSNTSALSILASVATGKLSKQETSMPEISQLPDLHAKGPFNPVSLLPPRTAKKILDLEFMEISDIVRRPSTNRSRPAPTPSQTVNSRHIPLGRKILADGGSYHIHVP